MFKQTLALGFVISLACAASASECETMKFDFQPSTTTQAACEQLRFTGAGSATSCDGKTAELSVAAGGQYQMLPTDSDWRTQDISVDSETREMTTFTVVLDVLKGRYQVSDITTDKRGHRRTQIECEGQLKFRD